MLNRKFIEIQNTENPVRINQIWIVITLFRFISTKRIAVWWQINSKKYIYDPNLV